ncbi:SH3 domain-containing protein [Prochlorococcus marinus]|uniref:SH3 domain-containing protein n=1 Tax=Prochlorococcus marinus TaxID=1219 RepID=UPI0039B0C363
MNIISTFIVWTWLLGIALVVPTTLPAGGAQESIIQNRKDNVGSPIIALKDFNLLSSASKNSSILTRVKAGTPVKILKIWDSSDSEKWLLVNIAIQDFNQLFYKRGWVNIGKS